MSAKILISGESNAGKTTLLKTLKDALVISHDGKEFPFPMPHINVTTFSSAQELVDLVTNVIKKYKEKTGNLPRTIVFDSTSKIFDTLVGICNTKYTGFHVYSNLNKEIQVFTDYIQNALVANGMNVVLLSHAIYDVDTAKYNLVGKGDFQKRGL